MKLCGFDVGLDKPFFLISGNCVVESRQMAFDTAGALKEMTAALGIPFIYKSSFDKANRTSIDSFRGPGIEQGLAGLKGGVDRNSVSWPDAQRIAGLDIPERDRPFAACGIDHAGHRGLERQKVTCGAPRLGPQDMIQPAPDQQQEQQQQQLIKYQMQRKKGQGHFILHFLIP